jgi:hypothetical protein
MNRSTCNGSASVGGKRPTKPPAAKPQSAPPKAPLDPEMAETAKLGMAIVTAPNTCEGQLSVGVFISITEIRNRRLLVIDGKKCRAVGFSNFYHDGKLKTMKIKRVPGLDSAPVYLCVFNMPAMHFFKIKKGKIYDMEATSLLLPFGTRSGWE